MFNFLDKRNFEDNRKILVYTHRTSKTSFLFTKMNGAIILDLNCSDSSNKTPELTICQ